MSKLLYSWAGLSFTSFNVTVDDAISTSETQNLRRVSIDNGARRYRLSITLKPDFNDGTGGIVTAHRERFGTNKQFSVVMPQWPTKDDICPTDEQVYVYSGNEPAGSRSFSLVSPAFTNKGAAYSPEALTGRYITFAGDTKVYHISSASLRDFDDTRTGATTTYIYQIFLSNPILKPLVGTFPISGVASESLALIDFNPRMQCYYSPEGNLTGSGLSQGRLLNITLNFIEAL